MKQRSDRSLGLFGRRLRTLVNVIGRVTLAAALLLGAVDAFAEAAGPVAPAAGELEEIVVVGEVAYTRSRDALSVTPQSGGDTTQLAGHRLTVYRKQPAGHWLLARDAHTLSPVEK